MRGKHPSERRAHCAGFTLVELMVVMILIAILTAMILPEMKGTFEDALLKASSRELVSTISLAYSRAVSLNREHRVKFDSRTGRYQVEMRNQEGPQSFVPLKDVSGAQGSIDPRVTVRVHSLGGNETESRLNSARRKLAEPASAMAGDRETVSFHPDGTADAAEIILRDRDGFRLALKINPITARVQVLEMARE